MQFILDRCDESELQKHFWGENWKFELTGLDVLVREATSKRNSREKEKKFNANWVSNLLCHICEKINTGYNEKGGLRNLDGKIQKEEQMNNCWYRLETLVLYYTT